MTQQDSLLSMFAAIDAESRRYVLKVHRNEFEHVQRSRRPVLRVVDGVQALDITEPRAPNASPSGGSSANSLSEAALLTTYRGMNDKGRDRLVSLVGIVQKRFTRQRPALTIVPLRQHGGSYGF